MAEEKLNNDNPVAEIHDAQAAGLMADLQNTLGRVTDGQANSTDTTTDGIVAPAGSEDSATNGTETPHTDLQSIREALPSNQAEAVAKIFADNTRLLNQVRELEVRGEEQLKNTVDTAVNTALREQAVADSGYEPDDPLAAVTSEQKHLFLRIADELGFVKSGDLKAQEAVDFVAKENVKAVEVFGESLGQLDSVGGIILSKDAKSMMTPIYNRLSIDGKPPPKLTYNDLMKIGTYDALKKQVSDLKASLGETDETLRIKNLQRAQTEGPGASVATSVSLRGEKGTPADKRDNVMARAFQLAKQQQSRNQRG